MNGDGNTGGAPEPPLPDGNATPEEDPALRRVLEIVPRGAFALAGLAVAILLGAWLFVYFCVFLPRGAVS